MDWRSILEIIGIIVLVVFMMRGGCGMGGCGMGSRPKPKVREEDKEHPPDAPETERRSR